MYYVMNKLIKHAHQKKIEQKNTCLDKKYSE